MIILQRFFKPLSNFSFAAFLAVLQWQVLAQSSPELASLDFVTGRALFEKNWVPSPASTTASDGLGPLYNARSCNQCHAGGGRGSREQSLVIHTDDPVYGQQLQKYALPGMTREASVAVTFPDNPASGPVITINDLAHGPLANRAVSTRMAPSLRGLGMLELIPDSAITAGADPDDLDGDGISGRVNRLVDASGNDSIGRFGWKASQATLRQQIGRALSLDLGLGNPVFPSAFGDCTDRQADCLGAANGNSAHHDGLEANAVVLDLLLAYVRELPAPTVPGARQENGAAGAILFARVGCSDCHLPTLQVSGRVLAPYTDLLLHDMGPGLADGLVEGNAAGREWRTAPLRELAAQGPFLHDGRAASLEAAIGWHDGEGARAREQFEALGGQEKGDLIQYLLGL